MPTIEATNAIPIGRTLTLTLRNSSAPRRCHIHQNGVLLPEPITLQTDDPFLYFPEAPGHYVIKGTDCEKSFEVVADIDIHSGPVFVREMWFPSAWTAAVDCGHESSVMAILPQLVRPDSVVYDIGANIGLYSRPFVSLTNQGGYVYCFEPNPIALHYLANNLGLMAASNYLILPVAISDASGTIDLVLNPNNHALGSMIMAKRGIRIGVDATSLDDAIREFGLRSPDLIKMDIEGGETVAIKGMIDTIRTHRPTLIFELHGQAAAKETLSYLDGYDWQMPGEDRSYAVGDLAAVFPEACLQVIGRPST